MMIYHGQTRKSLLADIDHYDIVITTYNTLAKEHDDKLLGKGKSPLHDFLWYRVVLDEGKLVPTAIICTTHRPIRHSTLDPSPRNHFLQSCIQPRSEISLVPFGNTHPE